MAAKQSAGSNGNYQAIVDMGSNGIRFSITDLTPPRTRNLPVIWQEREAISLYDAQWDGDEAVDIPNFIIDRVIVSLLAFRRTCRQFGVPSDNITVIATEATRTAKNSAQFIQGVKQRAGLDIKIVPKEEEGRIGAYGVASSLNHVHGIVMDLGGGSTQITWVKTRHDGIEMSSKGSVSMPFGAAALTRRLMKAQSEGPDAVRDLREEISQAFKNAIEVLKLPFDENDIASSGIDLYLSGGGFRGWGYVLLEQHNVQPYPIPMINGFQADRKDFIDTDVVKSTVKLAQTKSEPIFRVSNRRAMQLPAVAFLVSTLAKVLPLIKNVHFCQGGVREGFLFRDFSHDIQSANPLLTSSENESTHFAEEIATCLTAALPLPLPPSSSSSNQTPASINISTPTLILALANTAYLHSTSPKEIRAACALRSTATGHFSSVHGLSHMDRATLAIALCERHGGRSALSRSDADLYDRMAALVAYNNRKRQGDATLWVCSYLGRVAALAADACQMGFFENGDRSGLKLQAEWVSSDTASTKKKDKDKDKGEEEASASMVLRVILSEGNKAYWTDGLDKSAKAIGKLGKQQGEHNQHQHQHSHGDESDGKPVWFKVKVKIVL